MRRWGSDFLSTLVVLALVASTGASVYYMVRLEHQEIRARAQAELERTVGFLAQGMTEPVWTLVPEDARPLAEATLRDERVYRVQVTSTIQGLFLNVEEQGPAPARRSIVRQPVTRDDEVIGEVEVTFDDDAVERAVNPGWTDVYWVVAVNVVVAALAALLLFALGTRMRKVRERAERAELEAQRRKSEQRLQEVQRIVHIGHWYRDLDEGTIWLSEEAARIVGLNEVAGRPFAVSDFLERLLPEDAVRFESSHRGPDGAVRRFEIDLRVVRPNREIRHVAVIAQPVSESGGPPARLEGTMQDVTERKLLEIQLQHSERMKAVGQLTGGIAHDFNNLLTVIRGNLQLLKRHVRREGGERESRWIDSAVRSVDRGADLTQHLLAFSRRQRLVSTVVDVRELLVGMGEILDRVLGESITVQYRLAGDTSRILADGTELESAILNLALNARDAMPGGGQLTIESYDIWVGEDDSRREDGLAPGDYVCIAVTDNGAGMSPEVLDKAFEPFFTTKEEGRGTGLGLSTIFGFAKQSGGHAELRSEPGAGTSAVLYFPVHDAVDTAPAREPPAESAPATAANRERVLLVDDNDAVRETTRGMLEELGYDVSVAVDGNDAVGVLAGDAPFDLLLTDVVMPGGINGLELAARARKLRPGLRVICASGYAESTASGESAHDGALHWIDKPFDLDELARRVREALA